ncbi:hypothetical protein N9L92_00655 [Saprospiraceae bacterium]|nr:hypothetical protein [Saprospiraceae bacterium]
MKTIKMGVSTLRSPQRLSETDNNLLPFSFHNELDSTKIKLQYKSDLNFCLNMFEVCLHTVPIAVANMNDASEQEDYLAISMIANKLKSNFELVGHTEMVSILDCIESYAHMQNHIVFDLCFVFTSKVSLKLDIIRDEIIRISQYLKQNKSLHSNIWSELL